MPGVWVMPCGGNTPLGESDFAFIKECYDDAVRNGLQYEWLQWFVGGLVINKLPVREAANAACIEWDF
jgi:hypothetical protein